MKIKDILITFIAVIFCYFSSWSSFQGEENYSSMPFKIGFEFQESSSLCPWAIDMPSVQKKPLLHVSSTENNVLKELWHTVLDTSDLEYVTVPFSNSESRYLENCTQSIQVASNILENMLKKMRSVTFEEWFETIDSFLKKEKFPFYISKGEVFHFVKDRNFSIVDHDTNEVFPNWRMKFSPQVTIQHPLKETIFLYFSLFGFNSSEMISFVGSLPYKDPFLKSLEDVSSKSILMFEQGYQQTTAGLIFLHALTLYRLAQFGEKKEEEVFEDYLNELNTSFQVDAKMALNFMSRRPFSKMLRDTRITNYSKLFWNMMNSNNSFLEQVKYFSTINYGQQFFTPDDNILELDFLINHLDESFYLRNKEYVDKFLKKGVIMTIMLRNLKENSSFCNFSYQSIFENYLNNAINTVENPSKRFMINIDSESIETSSVIEEESNVDALSPPYFLRADDSMGKIHEDIDLEYGEAIVEIRNPMNLGIYFFEESSTDKNRIGKFLYEPSSIRNDSIKLFEFLSSHNNRKNEIYLLMTHTIRKKVYNL